VPADRQAREEVLLHVLRQDVAQRGVTLPRLVGDGVALAEVLDFDDYVRHLPVPRSVGGTAGRSNRLRGEEFGVKRHKDGGCGARKRGM
jgi:hypothetical protein